MTISSGPFFATWLVQCSVSANPFFISTHGYIRETRGGMRRAHGGKIQTAEDRYIKSAWEMTCRVRYFVICKDISNSMGKFPIKLFFKRKRYSYNCTQCVAIREFLNCLHYFEFFCGKKRDTPPKFITQLRKTDVEKRGKGGKIIIFFAPWL